MMNRHLTRTSLLTKILFFPFLLSLPLLTSCGKQENGATPNLGPVNSKAIVGEIDWMKVSNLPNNDPARKNSRAVGYISIPSQDDNRCTAFLVAPNLIMTNWHCFPEASHAKDARFYPEFEEGRSQYDYKETTSYDCSQLLLTNEKLDFALLRCEGSPGQHHGVLELESNQNNIYKSEQVYVIHQNCDYWHDMTCPPIKLYSPGKMMEAEENANEEARAIDIFYTNDTLGGSSGSPVFSKRTQKVIAIHHNGHGKSPFSLGRGTSNSGVPLHLIISYLKTNHPQIVLGNGRTPEAINGVRTNPNVLMNTPVIASNDSLFEPNDSLREATYLSRFSSTTGTISSEQDLDVFKFYVYTKGSLSLSLDFAELEGDLDLYLLDNKGKVLAKGMELRDLESLQKTLNPGSYFIAIVGHEGAQGAYKLNLR